MQLSIELSFAEPAGCSLRADFRFVPKQNLAAQLALASRAGAHFVREDPDHLLSDALYARRVTSERSKRQRQTGTFILI